MGPVRILVMDDEMMIRDLCTRMLEKMGYETDVADNGETALRKFAEGLSTGKRLDAAILDLTVKGGLGGREIVNRMTGLDPRIKVIASSGFADDPAMGDPAAFGFAGVLAKPYTWETLKNLLDDLLIKN
jgi:DNA-binding NtrC family response regulator